MSEKMIPWSNAYDAKRITLMDALPLSLPLCICIEPTNVCNFKCQMCWQSTKAYHEQDGPFMPMDMELLDKFLRDAQDFCRATGKKIKLIKLYSTGEPLLHKNIGEMIHHIKEAEICDQIEITTNASLLSERLAKEFVDYGLDYLRVSIYSVRKGHHKEVTQTNVTPETIAQNVRFLYDYRTKQNKQKPFICAKIMDMGAVENEEFRQLYAPFSDEQLIDIPWEMPKAEESVLSKLYGSKEAGAEAQKKYIENSVFKHRKACRYPFTHMTVRSNGDIVVCCTDWSRDTKMGNLRESTLQEIWESKRLYDFRVMQLKTKGVHHPLCATCELPMHDRPEDAIDELPVERLSWNNKKENPT